MVIKIIVLVSLLKLLIATDKPFLCSGIYTGIVIILSLSSKAPIIEIIIYCAISFALASLYFWLLVRFKDTPAYWGILVIGLFIGII